MKHIIVLAGLVLSVATPSFAQNKKEIVVKGKIATLLIQALVQAGVKPVKDKEGVKQYTITKFYSSDEGDGCGGGTTKYESSFIYANGAKHSYFACTGELDKDGNEIEIPYDKATPIANFFSDLDLEQVEGWNGFYTAEKVACSSWKGYLQCTIQQNK